MSRALSVPAPNSVRRKLAISTWSAPKEGNIYGKLTVEMTEALRYIDHVRARSGEKVTVTHLVGKAIAEALARAPGLNGVIRLGRYVQHDTVDISFLVALEEGRNLAKAKIARMDEKSVVDLAVELRELATRLYSGKDESFKKSMGPIAMLPTWLVRPLVHTMGYLTGVFGLSVPALGLEAHPFGACVITNVGVFGLDEGFAPPTPFAHAPVLVLVGAIREQAVVREGAVVSRQMMTICATIDHRYIDGAQGGTLAKVVRDVLENPWQLDGLDGPPAAAEGDAPA